MNKWMKNEWINEWDGLFREAANKWTQHSEFKTHKENQSKPHNHVGLSLGFAASLGAEKRQRLRSQMRKEKGKEAGSGVCNPSLGLGLCMSQAAHFGQRRQGQQKLIGHELLSGGGLDLNIFRVLWVIVEIGKPDFKVASCFHTCYYGQISRQPYQPVATHETLLTSLTQSSWCCLHLPLAWIIQPLPSDLLPGVPECSVRSSIGRVGGAGFVMFFLSCSVFPLSLCLLRK